jgi:hypothetical protein
MSDPLSRWRHELERLQRELEAECRTHAASPHRLCHDHSLHEAASLIGDALWHLRRHQERARVSDLDVVTEPIDTDD